MRKSVIFPAVALSVMSFGLVAQAVPASAHQSSHPQAMVSGEDDDDDSTPATVGGGGGGGGGAPSGGVGTGAGGTATDHANSVAPFVATGAAGLGLLGAAAAMRRLHTVNA